jgi:geranylgeranyl diphosphate synthase type II
MELKPYLIARHKEVDRALDRFLPSESTPPATIHKAMRYSLFAGGKRLRPILCLSAAEACGGKISAALPLACAVECIHTYSLVHDDLPSMDNDDLRRGRATCHKVFGDGIPIPAPLDHAFEIAASKAKTRYGFREVFREIATAAGSRKLIAGQVADSEAAPSTAPSCATSMKTRRRPTDRFRLGAMAANASRSI